jgi:hypothetical protein
MCLCVVRLPLRAALCRRVLPGRPRHGRPAALQTLAQVASPDPRAPDRCHCGPPCAAGAPLHALVLEWFRSAPPSFCAPGARGSHRPRYGHASAAPRPRIVYNSALLPVSMDDLGSPPALRLAQSPVTSRGFAHVLIRHCSAVPAVGALGSPPLRGSQSCAASPSPLRPSQAFHPCSAAFPALHTPRGLAPIFHLRQSVGLASALVHCSPSAAALHCLTAPSGLPHLAPTSHGTAAPQSPSEFCRRRLRLLTFRRLLDFL